MGAPFNTIDLATLALKPGQATRIDVDLAPDGFDLGGERYAISPARVPTRLDISRTATGHALRLRLTATLDGPCMRCLEASEFVVDVDAREVDQPGSGDEQLTSPYVSDEVLDVSAWAHDAISLALPQTLLCRADCAGLCPECGVALNDVDPATHVHERAPDPRWAKLRELQRGAGEAEAEAETEPRRR
jgi:uncharacterized protein